VAVLFQGGDMCRTQVREKFTISRRNFCILKLLSNMFTGTLFQSFDELGVGVFTCSKRKSNQRTKKVIRKDIKGSMLRSK
jgi:hypothetical protein